MQALKFESTASDQRSARSTSSAISYDDSGLSDFLIERGVKNPMLGTRFHWYLMVEIQDDRLMSKMYGKVAYNFMTKLMEVRVFHSLQLSILHAFRERTVPSVEMCFVARASC